MRKKAFIRNAGALVAAVVLAAVFFSLRAQAQNYPHRTLQGHVPPAIARFRLLPVHDFPKTNRMNLAITLPLRNEATLNQFLKQLYTPGSPSYHKYLTPQQFTELFGPTERDYNAVIQYAQLNGLIVKATSSNRLLLDVSGSVDAVQKMLHTRIRVYRHPVQARMFFAPESEPEIDSSIPISHISGLDNYTIPRPAFVIRNSSLNNGSAVNPAFGSGPGSSYMGNDFRAAYAPGVTLNGAGQTIGLLELEGYYPSDIATYEANAGLPNVHLTNVIVDGFPGPQTGDTNGIIEVSLDIEMAVSMATNATIAVFEQQNGGNVIDILNAIAANNFVKQISSSWLLGDNASFDTVYKQMAAQGQSFFQASGDDGAFFSNNENVQQYSDDTNITLVGGTTLSTASPGGAWSSETVWNWYGRGLGTGGSGGGTNFNGIRIPSWQQGISMAANQGSTTLRNVPDVALTADNIYVEATNTTWNIAGTSCAAPLWAGFTALVNQQATAAGRPPVGFLNPALYAIGKSPNYTNNFHDINTGNNINPTVGNRWFAVAGYDLCTGWGTPNGQNLINTLAPPDPLAITPVAGFVATGFAGGPFAPNTQNYVLTNFNGSSITWSLINTSVWLNASSSGGVLAAGGAASVTINLNSVPNSLAVGTYNDTIVFSNGVSHIAQNFPFALQISDLLVVAPAAGLSAAGAPGGPFGPASQNFTLTNIGTAPLNWQATGPAWLNLSPSSGTVTNGKPFAVTAGLNANANFLAAGVYSSQVSFTDLSSGVTQNGLFALSVGQNLVQNGGFETGDFFGWTLNEPGSQAGDCFVDDGSTAGFSPHSGNFFAALGDSPSLGNLSQTLTTVTNQPYLLSLSIYSPNVSQVTGGQITSSTPNQFEVFWNGTNLFNHSNLPQFNFWSNLVFVVTAIKTNSVLQFSEKDTPWFLGLDDVNVTPIPLPNVENISRTSKTAFSMTWNALPGLAYKVQYSTNLVSTNWFNLSTNTAISTTLSVTNAFGTNQYRFYRILRLP